MTYSAYLSEKRPEFEQVIGHLGQELATMRTGRANPAMVDSVKVNVYATMMDLKAVASISVPEARTLVIQPWDRANLEPIEQALRQAELGMQPINDGAVIRLNVPQLTEETRRQMVKMMREKLEEARVAVRKVREKIRGEIAAAETAKQISEDERFARQEELDKMVKGINEKIGEIGERKEEEIMKV